MISRRILQKKSFISGARYVCSAYVNNCVPPSSSVKKSLILGFPQFTSVSASSPTQFDLKSSYAIKKCGFSTEAVLDQPVGEVIDVPLAQTGEGIAECELLKWFVQEGDQVEEFQPLCEVQSDKATIEITSRYKGKVLQILYGPGDIVKVGETLLKMISGSQASTLISEALNETLPLPADTFETGSESVSFDRNNKGGVLSTPTVRHLAKEYGININDILGTGKDGRVLKEDVLKYAANIGLCQLVAHSQASSTEQLQIKEEDTACALSLDGCNFEDTRMPLRGFPRTMVKSMTMAAKVPHFHYLEEINCNSLMKLKASFQNDNSDPTVKHTFLPFLIKSLSMALTKYPIVNSSFNEESYEVILKGSHNIGVAIATPNGLVVPNIKKVQTLSILEITKELSRLQQLALTNKLSSEDISGGTITLSNIGSIGGKFGSPILNLPEVAIIAIGRIQKLPRFADDGSIYPASIMNVNIGADHRIVDGATVARFCNEWKLLIEKPELLILHTR
ncbi:hypothetical protein MKW98_023627 [Papaver atlanticum]|uniref:Dihydrolipoamide acetyltransferase component of pyruvate dehydrogenase complex n=1 Tax=Papaver atlanticum TaxID=357466 RepID=A0AAD4XN86_9MAGN|nr:hypothetical protein MKW98_023627 [Papaver atlanticum]